MRNEVFIGDCLNVLQKLPEKSIHCCVTSPPYWGLRNYGDTAEQIGIEADPNDYIAKLVDVAREVHRVLRDDGTFWLNLGDCFANDGKWGGSTGGKHVSALHGNTGVGRFKRVTGLKPKDLVGMPWRVAFALQEDGWWLRSDVVWNKPNPMPEPVQDRPTRAHEYIFLLTKDQNYYYDIDAIREPFADDRLGCDGGKKGRERNVGGRTDGFTTPGAIDPSANGGRNKRSVWTIAPQPYREAHFAVMPPEIPRICIQAGSSEKGCCPQCGAPHKRMTVSLDWSPSCECNAGDPIPCIVLDPFAGSGTTLAVARLLGRDYVGIELNQGYAKLIEGRVKPAEEIRSELDTFSYFARLGEGCFPGDD